MEEELIGIDWETYYDTEFSLTKMPTAQYVRDKRFEPISCSILYQNEPHFFFGDPISMGVWLHEFPFERPGVITVAHNAKFDGSIMEWVFGVRPWKYFCTMMASNAIVRPFTGRSNLETVGTYYGVGRKGTLKTKGLHPSDLSPSQIQELRTYNEADTQITMSAAYILRDELLRRNPSGDELELIDLTVKKFTRPQLMLDPPVLKVALRDAQAERVAKMQASGVSPTVLQSAAGFAAELMRRGVEPPMKVSPTTHKKTYAFAKDDPGFVALLFKPETEKLAEGRIAAKSTLMTSRLQRMIDLSEQSLHFAAPLNYYAAHPGRFGGTDFINLQNFTRGSALRKALRAPIGMQVCAGDLSQIEARIVATLAGQHDLVEDFREGRDVYSKFASVLYGFPVNAEDHPDERFLGKTCILSLGYGSGHAKLYHTVKFKYGKPYEPYEAAEAVDTYRSTYAKIPQLWAWLQRVAIPAMSTGREVKLGPLTFGLRHVLLPNGMRIEYPNLGYRGGEYSYAQFGGYDYTTGELKVATFTKLYGGKLLENVVQALARIIMTTAEVRIARAGFYSAMSVHDELVYVIADAIANKFALALRKALTARVDWLPNCPISCTVKLAKNYGDAK